MSIKLKLAAACAVAGLGFTACSGSGTSPIAPTQDKLSTDILTFSVGTANIYGDLGAGGGALTGLNFAAAYRQPTNGLHAGDSAVLVSSPTITLPFLIPGPAGAQDFADGSPFVPDATSTIETGPAPGEVGTHRITSTGQTASTVSTFGTSGGVFGLGIEPFNYGEGGTPDQVAPYPVPVYDPVLNASAAGATEDTPPFDPNQNVPWGGPPAFDLLGDGTSPVGSSVVPAGYSGVSEGLDVFAGLAPTAGNYTLTVNVPANTAQPNFTASATLGTATLLGAIAPPVPTLDGAGGGTFTTALPAGVTEAYIQIIDVGPTPQTAAVTAAGGAAIVGCNGADAAPVYYTVEITPAGIVGTLPDLAGPGGTPSICTAAQNATANMGATVGGTAVTGDNVIVQSYGFDYPLYEASYISPSTHALPAPVLAGANGQSDVTISSAAEFTATSAGVKPQVHRSHYVFKHNLQHNKRAFSTLRV